MNTVTLNAIKIIVVFEEFNDWVNHATNFLAGFRQGTMICVDKTGNVLVSGEDFMYARDNDLFPVTAYQLKRSCGKP